MDSFAATCLLQLVSERYEKGSIILTSNKSYGDWGTIFADDVIDSALLDWLLHHSTTIDIKGEKLPAEGQEEGRRARQNRHQGSNRLGLDQRLGQNLATRSNTAKNLRPTLV